MSYMTPHFQSDGGRNRPRRIRSVNKTGRLPRTLRFLQVMAEFFCNDCWLWLWAVADADSRARPCPLHNPESYTYAQVNQRYR